MQKTAKNIISIAMLMLSFLYFKTALSSASVFATSSISMDISTLSTLDVYPETFRTVSQTIRISTDNYTGYNLTLKTGGSSASLINTSDNISEIPTLTLPLGQETVLHSDFTETSYGLSTDGTNFFPAPSPLDFGKILKQTSAASTDTTSLTYGVKMKSALPPGVYHNSFIIAAVVNDPVYSITYDKNTEDAVENFPENEPITVSNSGQVLLSDTIPTRTGYIFLGWSEDSAEKAPTFSAETENVVTLDPTKANALTLYAVWKSDSAYEPGTEVIENPDGSETVVTTDESGNISTQDVAEDGTVTGYTIDTANSGGLTVEPGENIDTGVIAFDGNAFTLHIRFTTALSKNNGKFIVTALEQTNNLYSGFSLYDYNSGYLRVATYNSRTRSSSTGLLNPNNYAAINSTAYPDEREYDVYISYDPAGYQSKYAQIIVSATGIVSGKFIRNSSTTSTNVPTSLTSATITIGGNGIDGQDDMESLVVHEFQVSKDV